MINNIPHLLNDTKKSNVLNVRKGSVLTWFYRLLGRVNPYFKSPIIPQSVNCSFHLQNIDTLSKEQDLILDSLPAIQL